MQPTQPYRHGTCCFASVTMPIPYNIMYMFWISEPPRKNQAIHNLCNAASSSLPFMPCHLHSEAIVVTMGVAWLAVALSGWYWQAAKWAVLLLGRYHGYAHGEFPSGYTNETRHDHWGEFGTLFNRLLHKLHSTPQSLSPMQFDIPTTTLMVCFQSRAYQHSWYPIPCWRRCTTYTYSNQRCYEHSNDRWPHLAQLDSSSLCIWWIRVVYLLLDLLLWSLLLFAGSWTCYSDLWTGLLVRRRDWPIRSMREWRFWWLTTDQEESS